MRRLVTCGVIVAAALAQPAGADQAGEILKATGVRGGLVVHVPAGGGRPGVLTAGLRPNERYVVRGLERDPDRLAGARKHIRSRGLYGPVSVMAWAGGAMPLADNLVNLVVCEDASVPQAEILRVLAPNGVSYVKGPAGWRKKVKPWPGEIDEWTHYLHGPDNNAVAKDTRVGPPAHLQWKSDPMWSRSHDGVPSSVALVVSAGGRLFSLVDEGQTGQPSLPQRWKLVARDAFNGTLLWKRALPRRMSPRSVVARDQRVYAAVGAKGGVMILDAATGKALGECPGTVRASELICTRDVLVARCRSRQRSKVGGTDTIVAVSADGRRELWSRPGQQVAQNTLAVVDGRVFFHTGREVVCLALADGKETWRASCEGDARNGVLMVYGQAVLVAGKGGLRAFEAGTGKPLWKGPRFHRRLWTFGARGLVWFTYIQEPRRTFLWTPPPVEVRGYDPLTGELKRTVSVPRLITPGHHVRCYPSKATERYLLLPKRGVEFVDLQGADHMRHDWLRAPCRHGVMAANGLLYAPPHQCFCYPGVRLTGYNALAATREQPKPQAQPAPRFQRGPAYPTAGKATAGTPRQGAANPPSSDWPMYRHDPHRSGAAGCEAPTALKRAWRREIGRAVSQPVVVRGQLFLAEKDAHTVRCLDAATGKDRWQYAAGGRIDSSPTVHAGLVLFGSTDGWVYCLRASDGVLAWRFRAAPREQLIMAFEQPESAWPVHGSVLVQNGVVYCTAGRSSYLDGGIWVYALDPATGKVLHEKHIVSARPDVTREAGRPFDMEGARTDLLVSDGTDLYMFFVRLAPDLSRKPTPRITKLGDREVSLHLMSNAGFLDTNWFDRSYWMYSRRWPGYYFAYSAPKSGQILVFDDKTTYGLHVFNTRQGHSPRFRPGQGGYELFADWNDNRPVLRPTAIGREKGAGYSRMLPPKWSVQIPIQAKAMVLAGRHLCLAGPPDVVPADDPYAAVEGRKGARLWIVSTEDGKKLAEYSLERSPEFDGLIAAGGRLYLASQGGRITCFGPKE